MTTQTLNIPNTLTRFPTAGLRELIVLSLPLMLVLFSTSLMGFVDRWLLGRYSLDAMQAGVNAVYLCMLFQIPCMRISSIAQIFVGQNKGAGNLSRLGEPVWQMIWFSLFTMFVTLPLAPLGERLFLSGTSIHAEASQYFRFLMFFNFLFPLNAALASFFIGQGKTKIVTLTIVFSHLLHFFLDFLLIFGISDIIPPLGILGAAISTACAQILSFSILFFFFLNGECRRKFGTSRWNIHWDSMWSCIKVGIPRALTKFILLASWTSIARIMIIKGDDYLLVLSIGGTLNLLFSFINEGIGQAILTISSNILGSKNAELLKKLFRSSFVMLSLEALLLSIPFFLFTEETISIFFKESLSPIQVALLAKSCHWLWLFFLFDGFGWINLSILTAFGDTVFLMIYNSIATWIIGFLPVYFGIKHYGWAADKLWLIMTFSCLAAGSAYFLRVYVIQIKRNIALLEAY